MRLSDVIQKQTVGNTTRSCGAGILIRSGEEAMHLHGSQTWLPLTTSWEASKLQQGMRLAKDLGILFVNLTFQIAGILFSLVSASVITALEYGVFLLTMNCC